MEEHNCELCKISYVTEKELKDHEWSLMHHIKVEQKKKGSVHKCSLCFTTCPNLIDYGKHLNGDKHKQAIEDSRVHTETLDPQEIQSRLHSGDKDEEPEQEHVRMDSRESRTHQRSYSQPSSRGQLHGNRRPYRRPGPGPAHYYEYDGRYNQNSFENPQWHKSGMRQMFPYQWRQPWEMTSPDPWEHPNHSPEEMDFQYHNNGRRNSYSQGREHNGTDRGCYDKYSRPERDHDVDKRRFGSEEPKKAVRFEDEVDEGPEFASKTQSNQESKRRRRNTDVTVVEQPPGGRTTKNSKGRLVDSPVCEADSTTDIEITTRSKKDNDKKSEGKKKSSTRVKKKKGNKLSPRSDEGESVLERAEKLCKELRDKREKAKKENQKGKKVEKNQEINKQLAKLSEINKRYVKGVLDDVDDSEVHVRTSVLKSTEKIPSTITTSSSVDNRPPIGTRSKNKISQLGVKGNNSTKSSVDKDSTDNVPSIDSTKHMTSIPLDSKTEEKSRDIDDIRKEIETEVHKSQNDLKKSLEESNDGTNEPEFGELLEENEDSSKSRLSMESTSRESLLKMVNSPRSRKERQQLAEVLRTYAKSQKRLSLPRFNLHMSGIYDNLENYGDFRLEELSPDVQLQIAELIEADVKPDLDELEKSLLSEIKAERLDDYHSTSSHQDKLLDSSLKHEEVGSSRLSNVDHEIQTGIDSLDDIKKEPAEKIYNPQSPQYSQEEKDFIEKFCSPGSPVRKSPHARTESQPELIGPICQTNSTSVNHDGQRQNLFHSSSRESLKVRSAGLRSRSNSLSALPINAINIRSDLVISRQARPEQDLNKKDGDLGNDALELWRKQYSKEKAIEEEGGSGTKNEKEKFNMNERKTYKEYLQQIKNSADFSLEILQKSQSNSDLEKNRPQGDGLCLKSPGNQFKTGQSLVANPHHVKVEKNSERTWLGKSGVSNDNLMSLVMDARQVEEQPQMQNKADPNYTKKILKAPPVSWFGAHLPLGLSGTLPFSMGVSGNVHMGQPESHSVPSSLGVPVSHSVPSSLGLPESHSLPPTLGVPGNHSVLPSHEVPGSHSAPSSLGLPGSHSLPPALRVPGSHSLLPSLGVPESHSVPLSVLNSGIKTSSDSEPGSTTVTTWSSTSVTQPQVMSSSEMSVSSETAESLVQTVFDISIKEEDIRQQLQDVDQNITRLQKIIEESETELKKQRERKASLKKEEENLRLKRRNILQEARDKQKRPDSRHDCADRPTPPLSEDSGISSRTISHSEVTDRSYNPQSIQNSHASYPGELYTLRGTHILDSLHGQSKLIMPTHGVVHPIYYQYSPGSVSFPGQEVQKRNQGSPLRSKSPVSQIRNPHGTQMREESPMQDSPKDIQVHDLLYQGADLSVADSFRRETTVKQLDTLYAHEKRKSITSKSLEVPYHNKDSTDIALNMNMVDRKTSSHDNEGAESFSEQMSSFKGKQSDDIIMVSDDQKQGSDIIIISDSPKRSLVTAEKPKTEFQGQSKLYDQTALSNDKKEEMDNAINFSQIAGLNTCPGLFARESKTIDADSDLKSYGFITLSNLMTTDEKPSPIDSPEQPVKIPKQSDSNRQEEFVSSPRSDKEAKQGNKDKVNVHYMGSLPHGVDQGEFLKKFRSARSKDDQMSFLVVDGDQNKDMYDKLQLLFHKPHSKEESHDQIESPQKDSNFQSFGSSCSLGENIKHYCNQNKPEETLITLSDEDKCPDMIVSEDHLRCLSPNRKKLKTKKERDRASVRKQKEECILESSSDCNSHDEDSTQMSKLKNVECVPEKIVRGQSLDQNKSHVQGSEVLTHRLLEEVQLETESDDSRAQLKDKFAERFKLKPDFLASLKAAVRSSLAKTEPDCEGVTCCGPEEQVSGLQVIDDQIYVSYIGCTVRKFSLKTGELIHTFDCSPHQISCLYVLSESLRLYTGGSSQHLLTFNAMTGQQIRFENLEEKLQCFHHNWGKLFIGTYTGSILVWSTKTDRSIDAYVCSDRPISCISSATEGAQKVILVAAYDSTVFVLSATSGLLIRILEGHTKTVFSLQVDGSVVYSGSGDKTVMEHNLQTGDMTWTYTQAAGIITAVYVFEDLLFCSSFDKFIRCYDTKDHKLKALYYGAERGLVTQMTVVDNKIVTGNRNGTVEVIPIHRNKESLCQFEGCCHIFGLKSHMLYHVMSDHVTPNTKMFRCLWKGCKEWLSTKEGQQEAEKHMKHHIFD